MTSYREFPPGPDLSERVECLWTLAADAATAGEPSRVFPDGCVELIVHLGTPWSWRAEDGEFLVQPESFVVGQLTRPFWLRAPADGLAMGARLRAGGARAFLGRDLAECRDTVVPLAELWGADAARDLAGALRAGDEAGRVGRLASALTAHHDDAQAAHPAVRAAVAAILEARGSLRIAPLARAAGWGERHFQRRFEREVGCLPRQFARTVRFQHLLSLLGRESRVDWAGLAWDSGFADQAHLIREFRRFTGATPGSFEDEALALARRFVSPERLERYFARS